MAATIPAAARAIPVSADADHQHEVNARQAYDSVEIQWQTAPCGSARAAKPRGSLTRSPGLMDEFWGDSGQSKRRVIAKSLEFQYTRKESNL